MPNHVDNDLRVTGPKSELKRFKEFAKEGDELLSANKFIPYPKEFAEKDKTAREWGKAREERIKSLMKKGMSEAMAKDEAWRAFPSIKDGYNEGGYNWCIANWGTKWGFYDIELVSEETYVKDKTGELFYTFNTAWSPILPVIKKMGEMFKKLEFDLRYFECGMGFNGMYRVQGGKVIDDKSGEYFGDRGG